MAQVRCVFAWSIPIARGYHCPAHDHPCTEIVFTNRSEGVLRQRKETFRYGRDSVFVYQPGSPHWIENRAPGEHLCLGVVGCRAESLPGGVWRMTPSLRRRLVDLRAAMRDPGPLREARLDLGSGLVVCDLLGLQPAMRLPPSTRAQRTRETIEHRLTTPLSLKELADRAFVSKEYLRQLFRKEFGESITHYVIRRRIELASRLLQTTADPVKEIAWQSGFANEYYFSRTFRKLMKASPSEWRAARAKDPEKPNP